MLKFANPRITFNESELALTPMVVYRSNPFLFLKPNNAPTLIKELDKVVKLNERSCTQVLQHGSF